MATAAADGELKVATGRVPAFDDGRLRQVVVWVALAIRLLVFPFAENKHADAPMRALIAERMNADPGAARDPRSFCQFGPLPIELARPFLALDRDARRSSRVLSLIMGMAVFWPFFALGRRMLDGVAPSGGPALALAGLALALSPLHVQVSTTAASEAIYLFLLLGMLGRLHAAVSGGRRRDYLGAGLLASLAAVTRYDTWLAIPIACAAALLFGRRDRRAWAGVALFACFSALLPLGYLAWSWAKSGDPFFFARYITQDHATISRAVNARLGGGLARLRQVGVWLVSFAAAMTPIPFLACSVAGWRQARRWSPGTRVVLAVALGPTALYLAKGLWFGDFEPLPRFAIAPGAVLLPVAAAALIAFGGRAGDADRRGTGGRREVALIAGGAALLTAVTMVLAFALPGRISGGPESIGPLTRLDREDRRLAEAIRSRRRADEGVFIDTFGYADIVIAHAARVPASLTGTLAHTRQPAPTLAESRARTGASWFAIHDDSWGQTPPADWPAASERLGHWRLAHLEGLSLP